MIVYGERALRGQAGRALLNLASRLNLRGDRRRRPARAAVHAERPRPARGRLRARPRPGLHLARRARPRRATASPRASRAASCTRSGCTTSTRCARYPNRSLWDRALGTAQTVIAVDSVLTRHDPRARRRRLPRRGLPGEGRHARASRRARAAAAPGDRPRPRRRPAGQRRAPAVAGHHRDRARARLRRPARRRTGAQVSRRLFEAVPFYAGLTLDEIGGRGVRWLERDEFVSPDWEPAKLEVPDAAPAAARRQAAARHVPPAVGGQGGRRLARAALHPRPPGGRALARRRRRARHPRRRPVEVGNGTRVRGHGASCAPRSRPAPCSSPRARARTAPTC